MTIKNTKSKGFTITANGTEVILKKDQLEILRETAEGESEPYTILQEGEYDIGLVGVEANKIPNGESDSLAFTLFADGITVGYLPDPPQNMSEKAIEKYNTIDVLLIPGTHSALIAKLAPSIVIPLSDSTEMAKVFGIELPEEKGSLTLNSADQLPEERELLNLG